MALLDRGTGGVPDVRNAIDGYEEKSPLYGFLQYRRRKVVLSYLPEGISRLVQGIYPYYPSSQSPLLLTRSCTHPQPVQPCSFSRFSINSLHMIQYSLFRSHWSSLRAHYLPHVYYIPLQVLSPPRIPSAVAG